MGDFREWPKSLENFLMDAEIRLMEVEREVEELHGRKYEARRLFTRDDQRRLRQLLTERARLVETLP